MRHPAWLVLVVALTTGAGCDSDLIFSERDLRLDDASVHDTPKLVSDAPPGPGEREQPVAILVHGFGATTFELEPVADDLRAHGVHVSQVLLRGHGTTPRDQAARSFEDWAEPIRIENARLAALGWQEPTIVAASLGAALTLDLLARGELQPPPHRLVLVSPLVEFADWRARFLPLFVRFGVRGSRVDWGGEAAGHWYGTRPAAALLVLRRLTDRNRKALARGIVLPEGAQVLVIHAERDRTVSGRGLDELAQGLLGAHFEFVRVPTDLHVPVKPVGCDRPWTAEEIAIQKGLLARIRTFAVR
jgi:carboxylesterase